MRRPYGSGVAASMPRRGPGIELPIRGIARLVGIELGLRHARIENVEGVETTVRTSGNEIASFQPKEKLASFAAILRIFTRGFSGLFAHRASTFGASDERQASPSTLKRRSCASWAS